MNTPPEKTITRKSVIRRRRPYRVSGRYDDHKKRTRSRATWSDRAFALPRWIWSNQMLLVELLSLAVLLYVIAGLRVVPADLLVILVVLLGLYWLAALLVWRIGLTLWWVGQIRRGNRSARVIDRIFIGDKAAQPDHEWDDYD